MWRRLLLDTLLAVVLAAALAMMAKLAAASIVSAACELGGISELSVETPEDFVAFSIGLALAFALPPVVAWVVAMVGRYVEQRPPSPAQLGIFLGVPALAFGAGLVLQIWRIRQLAAAPRQSSDGVDQMIPLRSLGLASSAAGFCVAAGLMLAVLVIWRARAAQAPSR